jgi:hypothetical protein
MEAKIGGKELYRQPTPLVGKVGESNMAVS